MHIIIRVGQVLTNDVPTLSFDHMPYGGVTHSGYGKVRGELCNWRNGRAENDQLEFQRS